MRKEKHEIYYFIMSNYVGNIFPAIEIGHEIDDERFAKGNYFDTEESAEECLKAIKDIAEKPWNYKTLTLNGYQDKAMTTCMDSCKNISYMLTNLVGEVGEFASKLAKAIRKNEVEITENIHFSKTSREKSMELEQGLFYEAGDILWQLAGLCQVMGWDLQKVAEANLHKLAERKANGTIVGNGDGVEGKERTNE